MRRPGDLYSFANLWRQYRVCRRNKRNTLNALAFEIDAEARPLDLQRELKCQFYVRYVDDLVLLHDDPDVLRHWREGIRDFLAPRTSRAPCARGGLWPTCAKSAARNRVVPSGAWSRYGCQQGCRTERLQATATTEAFGEIVAPRCGAFPPSGRAAIELLA